MKKYIFLLSFVLITYQTQAQDFITKWDLSIAGSSPNSITFAVGTSGTVHYTWQTIPAGTSGTGTFSGSTANINGLPGGASIQLNIQPANFNRINLGVSISENRIIDVMQWGSTVWTSMDSAFYGCHNLNITATDIPNLSKVSDMSHMFEFCNMLNGPANINNWNTSTVTNMSHLFDAAISFNQPIGNWNTSSVTDMSNMFEQAFSFNQNIGNWNTANVTDMGFMFTGAYLFNQHIGNWNTGNVTNMIGMFEADTVFNQPIGNWNTANVTNMGGMFTNAYAFNQPIGNWNTGNVNSMNSMFYGARSFNQHIGNWNTSNVLDLWRMFQDATAFNQPIGSWNLINAVVMMSMFQHATSFNQPIGNWNVNNVTYLSSIFQHASSFNQAIGNWNLNATADLHNMLDSCGMDCSNYSSTLSGWSTNMNCPFNRSLGAATIQYGSAASNARNILISSKGWTISGDVLGSGVCCFTQNTILNETACKKYNFNGQLLTASGVYTDTLLSVAGCDSIITLNLTINSSNNAVTQNSNILTASAIGANYQWLQCPAMTPIAGATSQSYTATANGSYACIILGQNGCSDTSICLTVTSMGIRSIDLASNIIILPNPGSTTINIQCPYFNMRKQQNIKVYNEVGVLVSNDMYIIHDSTVTMDVSRIAKGIYLISFESDQGVITCKFDKL